MKRRERRKAKKAPGNDGRSQDRKPDLRPRKPQGRSVHPRRDRRKVGRAGEPRRRAGTPQGEPARGQVAGAPSGEPPPGRSVVETRRRGGCLGHQSPRGRRWLGTSVLGEPEGLSGSFFATVLAMTDGRVDRRDRIIDAAMVHFAEHGYRGGRVEDIAGLVGVAKGTVFLDFGSKEGLFLAAFQRAVSKLHAWLDAPVDVVEQGFWSTLDWWLERTEEDVASDPVPTSRRRDRPLRHGHGARASHRPLHAQRRPVRHLGVRRVRRPAPERSVTTSTPR